MWKKIGAALIALLSTFSVVYILDSNLLAQTRSYSIGGDVYGRIGSPVMNDRIYLGAKNEAGEPLGWVIVQDYSVGNTSGFVGSDSYLAVVTSPLGYTTFFEDVNEVPYYSHQIDYSITGIWRMTDRLNTRFTSQDFKLIAPRNVEWQNSLFADATIKAEVQNSQYGIDALKGYDGFITTSFPNYAKAFGVRNYVIRTSDEFYGVSGTIESGYTGQPVAYPSTFNTIATDTSSYCVNNRSTICPWIEPSNAPSLSATPYDVTRQEIFYVNGQAVTFHAPFMYTWDDAKTIASLRYNSIVKGDGGVAIITNKFGTAQAPALGAVSAVRPNIELKKSFLDNNVVFSLSQSIEQGNGVVSIQDPEVVPGHFNTGEDMKLRILEPTMNAQFEDILIDDESVYEKQNISKTSNAVVSKEAVLQLKVTGNAGANAFGTNTISAMIFDDSGVFIKYAPLGSTITGSNTYELDLHNAELQTNKTYKIKVVNEKYNTDMNNVTPADCSSISDGLSIKVIDSLILSYTPTYDSSIEGSIAYEYDKNVNANDPIGTLISQAGDSTNTVKIIKDPKQISDGHEDDYLNFSLSSSAIPATSTNVFIKPDGVDVGTKGLKAGTYYFVIQGYDSGDNEITGATVNVVVTVKKTDITVSFENEAMTSMKIGSEVVNESILTENEDITLSGGKFPAVYTLSGGVTGTGLSVSNSTTESKDFSISIGATSTAALPATFKLKVTLPSTDNYNSCTAEKNIFVYNELSKLIWTPTKTTEYAISDVIEGNTVGTLHAIEGLEKYNYALTVPTDTGYDATKAANNDSFVVDSTGLTAGQKATVKTTTSLGSGTYQVQFKVTDNNGSGIVMYVDATLIVAANSQPALEFKDEKGKSITAMTLYYDDKGKVVKAEGGADTITAQPTYALSSKQIDDINANNYLEVDSLSGALSIKKVTEKGKPVKITAIKLGNANYSDVRAEIEITILPAKQSITFENKDNPRKVKKGDSGISEVAIGVLTSKGTDNSGVGGISYSSSNESVATVDAVTGIVTAVSEGNAIITAALNKEGATAYDANYETVVTTKTVNVYTGMSLTWTPSSPNLIAISSTAGDSAGSISVSGNSGPIFYTKSTNTGVENADAALFQLDPNNTSCGVKLVGSIAAKDVASHNNKFYIQVDVKDDNGTQTINLEITIDNADNDVYFKEGTDKVTKITKQFGENGNVFNFSIHTSNGGNETYSIVSSEPQDVVTTLATGAVTIQNVGTTKAQVVVGEGSGFDGKTITIPVEITKGTQEITFDDTTTIARTFVVNSQFSEPATLTETSVKISSSRTKTYDSKDKSVCTVDQAGLVTMLTKGNCEIEVKNTDNNWITTTATKIINLYDGMGVVFEQKDTPQADTGNAVKNSIIGKLTVSGGQGNKTSLVSTSADSKNKDAKYFNVIGTNVVLRENVTAADLASKYDSVKKKYVMYVQFETTDDAGTKITTDAIIEFKGAPLNAEFDTGGTGKITEVYGKDRTFLRNVINNPGGGTPVYQLKNDQAMPNDVLKSVAPDGTITILNANNKAANANPVMIEAVIPPSGGYEGKTIEVEVEITKADQTGFKFKNPTIDMQIESSLTVILEGKESTGVVEIFSPNNTILSVNGMNITAGKTENSIVIEAIDEGDRNYMMASATATVVISKEAAYPFIISVPNATYGDTGLKAKINKNGATGANQKQTWESSDPTIADIDENGNITIYKAGEVDITCTQTSTGEPSVSSTATLVIQPKPITITINDKSKYVGESVPVFDMTIPSGVLVGSDTISLPTFSCLDTSNTPVTSTTPAGSYPITGTYPTGANPNYAITVTPGTLTVKQDASLASWYHLEGVTSGNTLDPTKWYNEDVKVVLNIATEIAGTYDEISLDQTLWDSTSITVTKEDENSEDVYFRINASGILSTSQITIIKIDKTKPIVKNITGTQTNKDALSTLINNLTFGTFFKPGTLVSIKSEDVLPTPTTKVSGVKDISYEVYEIDRKTGIINSTPLDTGTDTPDANGNIEVKLDDIGLYRVCAIAKDNAGNVSGESCSDVNIKKIDVDIDNDGENEFQDPDNDGCPDINIALKDEKGTIYKINVDRDDDGIPDLNIDSDGDGIAEINVDSDKDGKPDLNLVILKEWKPTFCVSDQSDEYCTMKDIKAVINVDTGKDGVPDINIDVTGDMKADLNITKEGSEEPYSNITTIKTWKPEVNYIWDEFPYDTDNIHKPHLNIDTDGNGRPDMNLDTDNDGVADLNIDVNGDGEPEINIDSDGDGEADFNIDTGDDGIADENIIVIPKWKPDTPIKDSDFDTMGGLKANDTLIDGDSGIQIQKPGGSFLPNYSIKVDNVKDSIDAKDKGKIEEYIDDDTEIKDIYDVELSDGTSVIQPDGSIKVRIPVSEDLANTNTVKVIVEQADGSYKEVEATIKDGFIEYETDYLGKVGIIADKVKVEEPEPTPDPDPVKPDVPIPDFKPNGSGGSTPDTSVKGNYTAGIGGAGTGDTTNIMIYVLLCSGSNLSMRYVLKKEKKQS